MKKILSLTSILLFVSGVLSAQSVSRIHTGPWKFQIYFEDSSSQRDTITLIWDTQATSGVDSSFGEHIKDDINDGDFHVFITRDSSNVLAGNPLVSRRLQVELKAINYLYPIKIFWDSALFRAVQPLFSFDVSYAVISNDYFFLHNNDPIKQGFSLLKDSVAFCPSFNFGSQDHFPMYISIDDLDLNGVKEDNTSKCINVRYQKSGFDIISLCDESIKRIDMYNLNGGLIYSKCSITDDECKNLRIDLIANPSAFYLLQIITNKNVYIEKFQIN